MADSTLHVELVAADRTVWSGEAKTIVARTVEGDIGVLPGHAPVLSLLVDGVVEIDTEDGETWFAAVEGGFLSIADDRVSILSEDAQMSHEIDVEQAKADVEKAKADGLDEAEAQERLARAEAKVRAVEMAG
ncbi:F0F1 ATP synthase subunit epsilon [Solicola sp. PLA-1-18]|jgi:F-type H+-transporting ATPase subunit epsilon|uniref:F0F1 ATP synthase subunit epsilon n=1 Tax=Solicola sp. PLA-1-18 TaxID=3380532 RepID=UPI003B78AFBB